jgi:hypothetical protein
VFSALPLVTLLIELITNHIRIIKIFHAGLPEGHRDDNGASHYY